MKVQLSLHDLFLNYILLPPRACVAMVTVVLKKAVWEDQWD